MKVVSCQPYAPAAFSPRKYSWYSCMLEAASTPGPQCGRKDYFNEKFQWHHRESNPRASGLYLKGKKVKVLPRWGWVVSTMPRPLYPCERPGTYCIGGWVGPRDRSGRVRKISSPPGFDPRTVQPVASRYTDWAIPAHLYLKGLG